MADKTISFRQQLDDLKAKAKKKETRGRKKIEGEEIKLYSIGPGRKQVRFAFTRAVVEHFLRIREPHTHGKVTGPGVTIVPIRIWIHGMPEDLIMPAIFMRVEPLTFDPRARKVMREGKTERWVTSCPARLAGVIDNAPPTKLDFIWDEKQKGIWVIMPDALMREKAKYTAAETVEGLPGELAKRDAQEAAE